MGKGARQAPLFGLRGFDRDLLERIEMLERKAEIPITTKTRIPKEDTTQTMFEDKLAELENTYLKQLDDPDMALQSGYTYTAPLEMFYPLMEAQNRSWSNGLRHEADRVVEGPVSRVLPRMWRQPGVMPPTIHYWALVMMTRKDVSPCTVLSAGSMMVATLALQFILLAVVIESATSMSCDPVTQTGCRAGEYCSRAYANGQCNDCYTR